LTVTGSTFTGNTATFTGTYASDWADGGAIDNGEFGADGSVTVTGSTFTGNTATSDGGAADNGDFGDSGSMTVTASTFTGNSAGSDGGAIDSGDGNRGIFGGSGGSVTVTASTFTGNTASVDGATIDVGGGEEGDPGEGGSVAVAGDVFAGSCDQTGGSWTDGGYNAGSDSSCFGSPKPTDVISPAGLGLSSLASNGGPTQTIAPAAGSAVIGIIPAPAAVTLGGSKVALCPAADQRGYASAAGSNCDAGAVQTSGIAPALSLADTADAPGGYDQAGNTIRYKYKVTNTGPSPLSGITITDPAVPAVNCPAPVLAAGTAETCTGSYTVTQADVTAGKVTDTATATGTSVVAGTVSSNSSSVTVQEGWPAILAGSFHPAVDGPEGYYLSATGNRWTVVVTHPGTSAVSFTGRVTVPAGKLGNLTLTNTPPGSQASIHGRALTFQISNHGRVSGFTFTTSTQVRSITFALDVGGQPATASQLYQGGTPTQASSGSPLTYTR
jgi:hypothetical protein